MMSIASNKHYVACQRLASKEIAGESVLLNLNTGDFFGLNDIAACVWSWLQEPRSLDELEALLTAEFEVDSERARADLAEFLASLEQRKLIEAAE